MLDKLLNKLNEQNRKHRITNGRIYVQTRTVVSIGGMHGIHTEYVDVTDWTIFNFEKELAICLS